MTAVAPVLVTRDDLLRDEVLRLGAAAGVAIDLVRDVPSAIRAWQAAPLVLVGEEVAPELAGVLPSRRRHVHVLAQGRAPDELFRTALGLGAETIAELPGCGEWLTEVLIDTSDGGARSGRVVGVLAGAGGAGGTVFACALAQMLARREPTLLVDGDALGAGVDRVLGMEASGGVRWHDLHATTGRLSARALRESLPTRGGLSLLGWGPDRATGLQPFAMREVLSAGARGHATVVVDLPRHPDAVADEVLSRCDHVVLVSGVTLPAVASAGWVVRRLAGLGARRLLVVRGAGGLRGGDIAEALDVELVAEMSSQRGLDEAIDLGAGPLRFSRGPLARAARAVAVAITESARVAA